MSKKETTHRSGAHVFTSLRIPHANAGPKKRGGQARRKPLMKIDPSELAEIKATCEKLDAYHPYLDMMDDQGKNIEHKLPDPPLHCLALQRAETILARLRVDPALANETAESCPEIVALIVSREYHFHELEPDTEAISRLITELLKSHSHECMTAVFDDIKSMVEKLARPPHRNFYAFKAYVDFLHEFGFQPTRAGLNRFIEADNDKYPVDQPGPTFEKGWAEMLEAAGLSFLEPKTGK